MTGAPDPMRDRRRRRPLVDWWLGPAMVLSLAGWWLILRGVRALIGV